MILHTGEGMQTLTVDQEFQALIPPLSDDERTALEASVKAEGCRDALVTWDGVIVDGHNRYAICKAHGIAFQTTAREFEDRNAALLWIIGNQLARRNLTTHMRGVLVLKQKEHEKAKAADRQRGGQGGVLLPPMLAEAKGETRDKLAAAAGTSHGTLDKIETVERDAPEPIKQKARTSEISTNRAYELTREIGKLPEADRDRVAAMCGDSLRKAKRFVAWHESSGSPETNGTYEEAVRTGGVHYGDDMEKYCDCTGATDDQLDDVGKSIAKHHAREARRSKQLEAPPLPEGKYNLIYVDPPWRYEHVVTESRAIENHYPTMDHDEICALPVADMASGDCIMFMWATSPKLLSAMQVLESWGFVYRTCMVWVKDKIGMGYYARQRHELLLIAVKGSPGTPEPADRFDSVISAPRLRHSAKPDQVYEMLEKMYPHSTRVELFARTEREGWVRWGNEVVTSDT